MTTNTNQLLTTFLAAPQRPEGTLTFHAVQGFFYTLACSPEMITPSEWLPLIFNEQEADYATTEEVQSILQVLMALYNEINVQVMAGDIKLNADISISSPSIDNIGEDSSLGNGRMDFCWATVG